MTSCRCASTWRSAEAACTRTSSRNRCGGSVRVRCQEQAAPDTLRTRITMTLAMERMRQEQQGRADPAPPAARLGAVHCTARAARMTRCAAGVAKSEPEPWCSMMTATATVGLSARANPMNHECEVPSPTSAIIRAPTANLDSRDGRFGRIAIVNPFDHEAEQGVGGVRGAGDREELAWLVELA